MLTPRQKAVLAVRRPHLGAMPPGLPRGEIEDCGPYGVHWYTGFADKILWGFSLRSGDGASWQVGRGKGGFASREDAVRAAIRAVEQAP